MQFNGHLLSSLAVVAILGACCLAPTASAFAWRKHTKDADAFQMLAKHFHGLWPASDIIIHARVLRKVEPAAYPGELGDKKLSKETKESLQALIENLAELVHPDALQGTGLSSEEQDARICASANLEHLRQLAHALRASFVFQLKSAGEKQQPSKPSELMQVVSDLVAATRAKCLTKLGAPVHEHAAKLEKVYGGRLTRFDSFARAELEREHARFAAASQDIFANPEDLDDAALDGLMKELRNIHREITYGEELEGRGSVGSHPKLPAIQIQEFLRGYLLDNCRRLVDNHGPFEARPAPQALADASNILASEFITAITSNPIAPASQLWALDDQELAQWSLRFFTCERLIRVGEEELGKILAKRL